MLMCSWLITQLARRRANAFILGAPRIELVQLYCSEIFMKLMISTATQTGMIHASLHMSCYLSFVIFTHNVRYTNPPMFL
ncbi:hypothetical protein BJP05_04825 [Corynebacterium sp. NML98-0116]|nr:hypothetical protein BJP05_04825 [Corynebacterium sp. NML98-0116]OIR45179.1 hypothetical protein BJP06_01700 [Corynebacterium sp. NML120713]